jgi:alpha-ketoglutarate-dependent taurine dioxygenase
MEAAVQVLERRSHPLPLMVAGADASSVLALLPRPTVGVDDAEFMAAAARAARLLPEPVHDALCRFADEPPLAGAMVLRGMPVGDVPPTPAHPRAATAKDRASEFVLLTVGRRLGQPVGYAPEHGGGLVQNLVPTQDSVDRQTSTSSAVQLAFHTETAFHPHRPRYLLLLCLRGDPAGKTLLCSVPHAVRELPDRQVAVLREPRFDTGVDESFGRTSRRIGPFAVLAGDPAQPFVTFDADLTAGLDEEAEDALAALRAAVDDCFLEVTLEDGDLLVVDNAVTVHGRSPFPARFDGTDRWLQRVFVVPDLAPSGGERDGRVITTTFA